MKVEDLIYALMQFEPKSEVVIQKDYGAGYFSLHNLSVNGKHPGHDGCVLNIGEQIPTDSVVDTVKGKKNAQSEESIET